MIHAASVIPCYAADTAGVCSALYELGGMVVVHDASGCNSTYATHDEPRWVGQQSMIYISALTELDAIMGNDEKFIADVTAAALDQQPRFIAICGSPMPMMTGFDFDAAAQEIERRTGIPAYPMHTNGTRSYLDGAAQAMDCLAACFCRETEKVPGLGVNLLGATPLDFGLTQTIPNTRKWMKNNDFTPVSCFAPGNTAEQLSAAPAAHVNLVVSHCGLAAAERLRARFGIPYVCGLPCGEFSAPLAQAIRTAAATGKNQFPCAEDHADPAEIVVIGESITAASLASALTLAGHPARVLCPLDCDPRVLSSADVTPETEAAIRQTLADMQPRLVLADPLYQPILPPGAKLFPLPHFAFSGRCFDRDMADLTDLNFQQIGEFSHYDQARDIR